MTKPKVTFILMAYNQEEFIADAIGGALAQTYNPMEIIISDDGSPDQTYARMLERTDGYSGPHDIMVQRQDPNLGLAQHVNKLLAQASGEYIVIAAGDDISRPERTANAIEMLEQTGAALFHSDVAPIGGGWSSKIDQLALSGEPKLTEAATSTRLYIGATGVIHRRVFDRFGPLPDPDLYEDQILGFRSLLVGGVCFSPEQLVDYRIGGISQVSKTTRADREAFHQHRLKSIKRHIKTLQTRALELESSDVSAPDVLNLLARETRKQEALLSALEAPLASLFKGNRHAATRELIRRARGRLRG